MKKIFYILLLLISFSALGEEGEFAIIHNKHKHKLGFYEAGVGGLRHVNCYIKEHHIYSGHYKMYYGDKDSITKCVALLAKGCYGETYLTVYKKGYYFYAEFDCKDFCTKLYNDPKVQGIDEG